MLSHHLTSVSRCLRKIIRSQKDVGHQERLLIGVRFALLIIKNSLSQTSKNFARTLKGGRLMTDVRPSPNPGSRAFEVVVIFLVHVVNLYSQRVVLCRGGRLVEDHPMDVWLGACLWLAQTHVLPAYCNTTTEDQLILSPESSCRRFPTRSQLTNYYCALPIWKQSNHSCCTQ